MSAKSNQQRLYLFARAAYIFHQIDQSPISTATEEQRTEAFVYLFKNAFKVLANDSNSCRFSKATYGQKISYLSLVGGDCNLTYPHGLLPYQNPQSSLQNTKQLKTIPSKEFYSELSRLLDITVERLKSPNSSFESPLNGDAILNYTAVLEKQYAHMHIDSFISCVKDSLIVMDKYTDTPTHHLELASKLSKDNIANERIKITNRSSEKLTSDGKELFEIWLSDSQTENESIFYIDFYRHQILWENKNTSDFYPPVEIRSIRNSFKNMDVGNYLKAEMTRAFTSMPTVYEDRSSFDFIETLQFIYANGHELSPTTLDQNVTYINKYIIESLMRYESSASLMKLIDNQLSDANLYKTLRIYNFLDEVITDEEFNHIDIRIFASELIDNGFDFADVIQMCNKSDKFKAEKKCNILMNKFLESHLYCAINAHKLTNSLESMIEELNDSQDLLKQSPIKEAFDQDTLSL